MYIYYIDISLYIYILTHLHPSSQVTTFNDKKLVLEYARRSDEMPKAPLTIKHHPASVNLELLTSLLRGGKEKASRYI